MATAEEKRKAVAAARSLVRRLEYRQQLDEWLKRASTQPRMIRKVNRNGLVDPPRQHRSTLRLNGTGEV